MLVISASVDEALATLSERRNGGGDADEDGRVAVGNLSVDKGRHEAYVGNRRISLTPCEMGILAALTEMTGGAMSFDALVERAWHHQSGTYTDHAMVHSAIKRLRRKLVAAQANVRVASVRAIGFRLEVGDGISP